MPELRRPLQGLRVHEFLHARDASPRPASSMSRSARHELVSIFM
eukprot:CAMPEP_0176300294 /NCGR_PEP_ID=MMETSP0121_2-20121125/60246_1 /TAXON_ID=160619 /ORGANISM="Kryptoperidinium foliaceum, Strain CCMP 1326" /LENGTH=43 /DNA_ID= /DNA_START= /DNA_END= /DNA_ORIENTATION=